MVFLDFSADFSNIFAPYGAVYYYTAFKERNQPWFSPEVDSATMNLKNL